MHIPHHLVRTLSGNYAFRQRVPSDLQVVIGRRLIKHTLRTPRLASARLRALTRASSYAHAYDLLDPESHSARNTRPQVTETITLEKARDAWLASIKPRTLPKTYTIERAAVESLVAFLEHKSKLHTVCRPDLARWYQHLRDNGASAHPDG